jgi:uncharacterized protein Yka (UPF0111/DUF47 family)
MRLVVQWWRSVMVIGLALAMTLMAARAVWADDNEDARRREEAIDRKLGDLRGPLKDAGREQVDRALDRLSDVADKAREVLSLAQELRSASNVSDDHKRAGEKHGEAAQALLEALKGLRQMKASEVRLRAAELPRRCDELDRKLKDFVDGVVSNKDHEGPQKIRELAAQQATPVRDALAGFRSQDGDFSSWNSQAERFSYSDGRWSDVRSDFHDARNYTRDGWKKLLEDADRGCERVTRWQDNRVVTDALTALGDRARSKDEVRAELGKKLEQLAKLVTGVERNSSTSEIDSAVSTADAVASLVDRLKDVGGTDPAARAIVQRWPEHVRKFKEAAVHFTRMKEREYLIDRARDRCQAAEQELLALIKDLEDKAPIDQDREEFYDRAKEAADRAAEPIRAKLKAADAYQDELRDLNDKVRQFAPEDSEWRPIVKSMSDSALAILEYYRGALRETHRYCDEMTRAGDNPSVGKALRGDCSESTYRSLVGTKKSACERPRACKGNQSCDDLVRGKRMNVECYDARLDLMNTCFRGGDHKHYQALVKDATEAIAKCDDLIPKVCK